MYSFIYMYSLVLYYIEIKKNKKNKKKKNIFFI